MLNTGAEGLQQRRQVVLYTRLLSSSFWSSFALTFPPFCLRLCVLDAPHGLLLSCLHHGATAVVRCLAEGFQETRAYFYAPTRDLTKTKASRQTPAAAFSAQLLAFVVFKPRDELRLNYFKHLLDQFNERIVLINFNDFPRPHNDREKDGIASRADLRVVVFVLRTSEREFAKRLTREELEFMAVVFWRCRYLRRMMYIRRITAFPVST